MGTPAMAPPPVFEQGKPIFAGIAFLVEILLARNRNSPV